MTERVPLFERLPAIYRTRDEDLSREGQFEAYIGLMDEVLGAADGGRVGYCGAIGLGGGNQNYDAKRSIFPNQQRPQIAR